MQASRKLASFLKPYWLWAVLAPLLMVLEVSMDLLQPWLIERIIDTGIAQNDVQVVISTGAIMIGVAFIGLLGGMGCTVFAVLAAQGFGTDLRHALFAKVQALAFGNLDELDTGKLITRLTNDVTQVQEMVMMLLRIMVRAPLLLIGSVIMGIITSPLLALLFLVLIPIIAITLVWIIRKTFPLFGGVQRKLDTLNVIMQENLAGVRVVKAFVRAGYEMTRFANANDDLMQQTIRAVRTMSITLPLILLAMNFGVVATLWFGGLQVQAGMLEVGQVIAFTNYLTQALMALMMVSMLVMRIPRAEASAVRLHEVLDSIPQVVDQPDARKTFTPAGTVAYEHVSFRYAGDDQDPVLKSISFVASAGQTVAILGATGSGKSSLVNLLPRFYDVSSGRITIDGVDVRAIDQTALRHQVSIALQESILFSGTIRDNIRYGCPDASDEEVITAAKVAQAHDFIATLPDGYDSLVSQRGVNLSGGQKQRIAIARAILVQPAVLVLDDSTSAVDIETEARIQALLAEYRHGRTNLIVAQRISTVLGADKILVLDDGEIVAEGNHTTLLAASPIYREIFASQMDPEEANP